MGINPPGNFSENCTNLSLFIVFDPPPEINFWLRHWLEVTVQFAQFYVKPRGMERLCGVRGEGDVLDSVLRCNV